MFKLRCGVLASVAISMVASVTYAGSIRYVDDDAPLLGDGLSWDTAYRFLQDALTEAAGNPAIDEIRVGQGVYKPDRDEANPSGTGDRNAAFQFMNGVALRGGYAGLGAPDPDERDVELYETILSGDLLGNDDPNDFPAGLTFEENSYHVLTGSGTDSTAILDGVVVTAGSADRSFSQPIGHGGGVYAENASPVITSCTFTGNFGRGSGGGIYFDEGSPTVTDCMFIGNATGNLAGGGGMKLIVQNKGSHPIVVNCSFVGNSATNTGGGLEVFGSSSGGATVLNCVFRDNTVTGPTPGPGAAGGGGAIAFFTDVLFANCTFSNNRASNVDPGFGLGGGLALAFSNSVVTDCTFDGNSAVDPDGSSGGALFISFGDPMIANCVFQRNHSERGGAIGSSSSGFPKVVNCLLSGNTADTTGGGISCTFGNLAVRNCTITANVAGSGGGAVQNDASVNFANCIVWGNSPDSFTGAGSTTVAYSNVEGGFGGTGNIDADPMFVQDPDDGGDGFGDDPTTPDTDEGENDDFGDLRLLPGSACIDAGDNTAVPEDIDTDFDGNPRFVDDPDTADTGNGDPPIVDMGSYEFQGLPCPWDLNGDGNVNVLDLIQLVMSFGPCEGCPADINEDGIVNVLDLIALIMNFGPCPGTPCVWDVNGDGIVDQSDVQSVTSNLGPCEDPENCPWDVNGDGVVNGQDVAAVATHFGPCP